MGSQELRDSGYQYMLMDGQGTFYPDPKEIQTQSLTVGRSSTVAGDSPYSAQALVLTSVMSARSTTGQFTISIENHAGTRRYFFFEASGTVTPQVQGLNLELPPEGLRVVVTGAGAQGTLIGYRAL